MSDAEIASLMVDQEDDDPSQFETVDAPPVDLYVTVFDDKDPCTCDHSFDQHEAGENCIGTFKMPLDPDPKPCGCQAFEYRRL